MINDEMSTIMWNYYYYYTNDLKKREKYIKKLFNYVWYVCNLHGFLFDLI